MRGKIKIAILDTYVNNTLPVFEERVNVVGQGDKEVQINHATSICDEIIRHCPEVLIDVYPIFENSAEIDQIKVVETLELIYLGDSNYNIILMSLGFDSFEYFMETQEICNKIREKGTILISAFNHGGGLSIPAAFDCVLGVDITDKITKPNDFFYLENKTLNIVCSNKQKRVASEKNGEMLLMAGTSISAAYICGYIANGLYENKCTMEEKSVKTYLKSTACKVYPNFYNKPLTINFTGKRVVAFPYTKEIASMIFNKDYMGYELVAVFDFNHSIHIGTKVKIDDSNEYIIQGINQIEWEKFDIFVIGHINQYISSSYKVENIINKLIIQGRIHGKEIYCFDSEPKQISKVEEVVTPSIDETNVQLLNRGRLWNVPLPTVAIVGTGSRQGKFSTMLRIKRELLSRKYNAAIIATEPSGPVFNAEFIFPYGYNSTVNVKVQDYPVIINQMLYDLFLREKDIVLMELQSSVLGRNYFNIDQNTCIQNSVLYGLNPDAHIIIIFPDDDILYVERINQYMTSHFQSTLIGILIFPISYRYSISGHIKEVHIEDAELFKYYVAQLQERIDAPVLKMEGVFFKKLCDLLIDSLI